jgi:hypothetical protein
MYLLFHYDFLKVHKINLNACTYRTLKILGITLNKLILAVHVERMVKMKNCYRILV